MIFSPHLMVIGAAALRYHRAKAPRTMSTIAKANSIVAVPASVAVAPPDMQPKLEPRRKQNVPVLFMSTMPLRAAAQMEEPLSLIISRRPSILC